MPESAQSRVFAALADPTRRTILEQLSLGGVDTATRLAGELKISRQAVAKHLTVLAEAGLASATKVGREARYRADLEPLAGVSDWVERVEGDWRRRLDLLAQSLESRAPLTDCRSTKGG